MLLALQACWGLLLLPLKVLLTCWWLHTPGLPAGKGGAAAGVAGAPGSTRTLLQGLLSGNIGRQCGASLEVAWQRPAVPHERFERSAVAYSATPGRIQEALEFGPMGHVTPTVTQVPGKLARKIQGATQQQEQAPDSRDTAGVKCPATQTALAALATQSFRCTQRRLKIWNGTHHLGRHALHEGRNTHKVLGRT